MPRSYLSVTERWLPCPIEGFAHIYEISDHGRLRNAKGKIVVGGKHSRGYWQYLLCRQKSAGGNKTIKAHRLVALAFLPNPDNLPEVNHKDLDKLNNHVSNLEWVSHLDNHVHCLAMGKYDAAQFEERRRKLTPENVIELREMRRAGATFGACAAHFGISASSAAKVSNGYSWPTLPGVIPAKRVVSIAHVTDEQRAAVLAMLPMGAVDLAIRCGLGKKVTFALLTDMLKHGQVTCSRVKTKMVYRARSHRLIVPSKDTSDVE
jgi:hypothetical protein